MLTPSHIITPTVPPPPSVPLSAPRWFEMATGTSLFTIIKTPVNYFEYTGRKRTDVPTQVPGQGLARAVYPLVLSTLTLTPLNNNNFVTHVPTQDDGGGSVAIYPLVLSTPSIIHYPPSDAPTCLQGLARAIASAIIVTP